MAAALACLLATSTTPQAETEPNNEAARASPIAAGEEFSFQFKPRHDRDYFKLTSPGNGTVRFRFTSTVKDHKGIHPWWETKGENGKWSPHRNQLWDRRVAQGYETARAINSGARYVIDPAETREWIARGLKSLPPKAPRKGKKRPYVDTW